MAQVFYRRIRFRSISFRRVEFRITNASQRGINAMHGDLFRNQRVIVTGASSGIGAALTRQLAAAGGRVAAVARRRDRLEALAREMANAPGEVVPIAADLTEPNAAQRVKSEAEAHLGGPVEILINNAGFGVYGQFASNDLAYVEKMMALNMNAVVRLTHAVLPAMLERKRGHILSIASTAAFQPTPYMAVYGATKSFVLSFSMALWLETRKCGVGVTCVCPGPVATEFFDRGGYESRKGDFSKVAMSADRVALEAIRAMAGRRSVYVPGWKNKIGAIMQRFAPLRTVTRLTGKLLGPK
jgi:uncharacterized protein